MNGEPEELPVEEPAAPPRRAFPVVWQAVVLCGLFVVLQIGCGVLLTVALMTVTTFPHATVYPESMTAITAVANVMAFAGVFATARLWSGLSLGTLFPFRRFRLLMLLPMALTIFGMHVLLSEADNVLRFFLPVPEFVVEVLRNIVGPTWIGVLTVVAVAPLTEEPFFRGIVLGGFLRNYPVAWAVALSSLLFGFIHLNPWQFFSAFALGLLFSWWMIRTGSLWPCLFGHALSNGLSMGMGLIPFSVPGYNSLTADSPFQPLWFDLAGLGVALCGILWLRWSFGAEELRDRCEP